MSSTTARTTKVDRATAAIKSGILDGRHPPGSRLVSRALAHELDMSELPIREALRRLEAEGLVQYKYNSGATVAQLEREAFEPLQRIVAYLEGAVTAEAVELITKDAIEECRGIISESRGYSATSDAGGFDALSTRFHELLTGPCPNQELFQLYHDYKLRLSVIRGPFLRQIMQAREQYIDQHEQILDYIENGAPTTTIQMVVQKHRLHAFDLLAGPRDQN